MVLRVMPGLIPDFQILVQEVEKKANMSSKIWRTQKKIILKNLLDVFTSLQSDLILRASNLTFSPTGRMS